MDGTQILSRTDSCADEVSASGVLPSSSMLQFFALREAYGVEWPLKGEKVWLRTDLLTAFIKMLADQVFVDEEWYRKRYPDVDADIGEGKFRNAKHHYVEFGYFEDRQPHYIEVDDKYYRSRNPDVAKGLRAGEIPSSQVHFEKHGFQEGRRPRSGWQLITSRQCET